MTGGCLSCIMMYCGGVTLSSIPPYHNSLLGMHMHGSYMNLQNQETFELTSININNIIESSDEIAIFVWGETLSPNLQNEI